MSKLSLWITPFFGALSLSSMLFSEVSVPAIFSDNAVLQIMEKTPVWGWAEPGETVKVSWGSIQAEGKGDAEGRWRTYLNLKNADTTKAQELVIEGKNKIVAMNVVVGEVWFCSGQSNMQWTLDNTLNAKEEILKSANPMIREFKVALKTADRPQERGEGRWVVSTPAVSANFSAVGYYFSKKINQDLQRPVGFITSAWGGTPLESWTSSEGFAKNKGWDEGKEKVLQRVKDFEPLQKEFASQMIDWTHKTGRQDPRVGDPKQYAAVDLSDLTSWIKVKIPGPVLGEGIPAQGVVWVRHQFDLPMDYEGKALDLRYGSINNFEEVYLNGEKIAETTFQNYLGNGATRTCKIPPQLLKGGKNVVAIRIYAPMNPPVIFPQGDLGIGKKKISGEWLAKTELSFPLFNQKEGLAPKPIEALPLPKDTPTYLYNAMVHPWISYGIKGVNWYQGETNAGKSAQYQEVLPIMIQDWRQKWGQGDFQFNICQLASFAEKKEGPMESGWAELRDAQAQTLSFPNTGLANLIDIGESEDIHPRNKKEVGERLAKIALAKVYDQKIPYSGPIYESMKQEGSSIRIQFTQIEGGLIAKPLPEFYDVKSETGEKAPLKKPLPESPLQGFAICGEDKQWVWANAVIDGETVVVSSPQVEKPIAVRYAWADNPTCNLYNGANLPAVSFRTDRFPRITEEKKYP